MESVYVNYCSACGLDLPDDKAKVEQLGACPVCGATAWKRGVPSGVRELWDDLAKDPSRSYADGRPKLRLCFDAYKAGASIELKRLPNIYEHLGEQDRMRFRTFILRSEVPRGPGKEHKDAQILALTQLVEMLALHLEQEAKIAWRRTPG